MTRPSFTNSAGCCPSPSTSGIRTSKKEKGKRPNQDFTSDFDLRLHLLTFSLPFYPFSHGRTLLLVFLIGDAGGRAGGHPQPQRGHERPLFRRLDLLHGGAL